MKDTRRHPRYIVGVAADIGSPSGLHQCEVEDLSPGGCRVAAMLPLPVGTPLHVRISSARVDFDVAGAAAVAWSSGQPPYRTGIAFAPPLVRDAARFLTALLGPVRLSNPFDE